MSAEETGLVEGLSLRDYFAGCAMMGLVAASPESVITNPKLLCQKADSLCEVAYAQADALLAERARRSEE